MRHNRRIIIIIDECARAINEVNNINCIEKDRIGDLPQLIKSKIQT